MRLKRTDNVGSHQPCPQCRGHGYILKPLDVWYIDYHYQDCHEMCGPYTREQVRKMLERDDGKTSFRVIGPDGYLYSWEK